jgi:hypothetical protein
LQITSGVLTKEDFALATFVTPPKQPSPLSDDEQKALALDAILEAWDTALSHGVEPEMLASTAIFAALTDMVDIYGTEAVAEMCAGLPDRVRRGEFTFQEQPDPA